ncbi:transposase [Selenomonas flueggei]
MNALQKDFPLNEFFRQQLESAVNGLLQSEITAFLGYEKHSSDGWNSGNSRNGSYVRTLTTSYGDLRLLVPRDRNGLFAQKNHPTTHTAHRCP